MVYGGYLLVNGSSSPLHRDTSGYHISEAEGAFGLYWRREAVSLQLAGGLGVGSYSTLYEQFDPYDRSGWGSAITTPVEMRYLRPSISASIGLTTAGDSLISVATGVMARCSWFTILSTSHPELITDNRTWDVAWYLHITPIPWLQAELEIGGFPAFERTPNPEEIILTDIWNFFYISAGLRVHLSDLF